MSLEPSFSIEQFPGYTTLNIGAKIMILRVNPAYNALKIDNTTLSLDHARLPRLLKLFEGFLEGLFVVLKQLAPMIILPASITVVEKIQHLTYRIPNQLN